MLSDKNKIYLSQIIKQLVELWMEEEEDEYGRLRPTKYAFDKSVQLLVDTTRELRLHEITAGCCVSTDSEGGVRLEWIQPKASIHLVIPSDESREAYIYHEVDNEYATDNATPERLAYWLQLIKEKQ